MTGGHYLDQLPISPAYRRVEGLLERGGCVLLDGGIATELQRVRSEDRAQRREPWGRLAVRKSRAQLGHRCGVGRHDPVERERRRAIALVERSWAFASSGLDPNRATMA